MLRRLAACLAFAAGPAGAIDLVPADTTGLPASVRAAVVLVSPLHRITRGSGVLIGPCHVLTSYHVVFGSRGAGPNAGQIDMHPEAGKEVVVLLPADREAQARDPRRKAATGAADRGGFVERTAAVVTWGENYPAYRSARDDWALVRLTACEPGRTPIALFPADTATLMGAPLIALGYPGDKARELGVDMLWASPGCNLTTPRARGGGLGTSCELDFGMSGGPMVMRNPASGRWEVVALNARLCRVQTDHPDFRPFGCTSAATPIHPHLDVIRKFIDN